MRRLQMHENTTAQHQAFIRELKQMNSASEQQSSELQTRVLELQAEVSRLGLDKQSLQFQLQEQRRQLYTAVVPPGLPHEGKPTWQAVQDACGAHNRVAMFRGSTGLGRSS